MAQENRGGQQAEGCVFLHPHGDPGSQLQISPTPDVAGIWEMNH